MISQNYPELVWTASNGLIGTAIDDEMMDAMVKSGLQAYTIGVESGNSEVVKDIRKPTTLNGLINRKPILKKYAEVLFMSNFILGFPGETFSQMLDTFLFTRKLECDWSKFFVCQPLKGTDIFNVFQSMGDDRTENESWESSGPNPGRMAAESGGMKSAYGQFSAGWDIFQLETTRTFTKEEHDEIWFTFNLVGNFLNNPCYNNIIATKKLSYLLSALRRPYPNDASMAAALAHCYKIMGNVQDYEQMKDLTIDLIKNSTYWQQRVKAFPELMTLAGITRMEKQLHLKDLDDVELPDTIVQKRYSELVRSSLAYYDHINWMHAKANTHIMEDIRVSFASPNWG